MFRRSLVLRRRAGMTLVELVVALAGLGLLGCLMFTSRAFSREGDPPPPPILAAVAPAPPATPGLITLGDVSLQETLDRLGYSVNVPQLYQGHVIGARGYRVSTEDDSIPAGWFQTRGPATLQEVSRQSALGSSTSLLVATGNDELQELFGPPGEQPEEQMFPAGRIATLNSPSPVRLAIDFPDGGISHGPLFSTRSDNPGGSEQLLVLPARTGGRWVDTEEGRGYWEGGADTGEYLLCWEDLAGGGDCDFQDLVLLGRGLVPVTSREVGVGSAR